VKVMHRQELQIGRLTPDSWLKGDANSPHCQEKITPSGVMSSSDF